MQINPLVIDISHYQSLSDWVHLKETGLVGLVNKATEGPGFVDTTFAKRRAGVQNAGLLYGAYHFARPGSALQQARHFLDSVGETKGLMLALDHEDPRVSLSWACDFLSQVELLTGQLPALYSGFLLKSQISGATDTERALLRRSRLWLAHYSRHPSWPPLWTSPWLWQYTSNGHGIDGDEPQVDMDSFAGTPQELKDSWAEPAPASQEQPSAQTPSQEESNETP